MAVRSFNGSGDLIGFDSLEVELTSDAFSIVSVVSPTSLDSGEAFIALRSGGNVVASLADGGTGRLALYTQTDSVVALVNLSAGAWQVIAVTKPAGTAAPRFHRKAIGSGGWIHITGDTALPDIAGTTDTVFLGSFTNGGVTKDTRHAVSAVYDSELTDSDVEAIEVALTTQFLVDLNAVSVWETNQVSTATPVTDLVSDADQVAISGTSVVADDDPDWTFGATVVPPLDFSLRLSGGAANASPAASIGGAESSVEAGVDLFDAVSNTERTTGIIDYRLIYVHNEDADEGTAVAWVPTNFEAGRELAIGVATEAAGDTVAAIADDRTAPAGVTFSTPTAIGGGVDMGTVPAGESRGLWVRRSVDSGTAVDPTNLATIQVQVLRTA